jgi:5-deoxy-glucuronate isomerase
MNEQMNEKWYIPAPNDVGSIKDGWITQVDKSHDGWQYTAIRIGKVSRENESGLELTDKNVERVIVPLSGSFSVCDIENPVDKIDLEGRSSVWEGASDVAYFGCKTSIRIKGDGVFAVCEAYADKHFASAHVKKDEIPIELRGSGSASREVRNFGMPNKHPAQRIITCEVLTPSGNWSSYPSHKHDTEIEGKETRLEEIYFFLTRQSKTVTQKGTVVTKPDSSEPHAYQCASASDSREIEICKKVKSFDIVLVPYGWHGPSMAPPGYDLYYLNVMAGPGKNRDWLVSMHPEHKWLYDEWEKNPNAKIDSRLPLMP